MSNAATEVFRTPDERFAGTPGYQFAPHYVELDGLRLHYCGVAHLAIWLW